MKKNILTILYLSSLLLFFSCAGDSNAVSPTGTGQGGSMARFAVVGDYLYVVDTENLHVYDLTDPSLPVKTTNIKLGFDIETIFPYEGKLYIGSMTGMHIYDIATPNAPVYISTYSHITSCDPVVVQGNLAYVTLRTGSTCRWGNNQLDIVDISNPKSPQRITTFEMENPFGLGIDDTTLFVCEGQHGLKVFNVKDPKNIKVISSVRNVHAFDVIPIRNSNNLILTGKSGIFQYDYTQPEQLKLNSALNLTPCE